MVISGILSYDDFKTLVGSLGVLTAVCWYTLPGRCFFIQALLNGGIVAVQIETTMKPATFDVDFPKAIQLSKPYNLAG